MSNRKEIGVMLPVLHLNGSGEANLLTERSVALSMLRRAEEALRAMAPHGRDYYVSHDENALQRAIEIQQERISMITDIMVGITTEITMIIEQSNENRRGVRR
jgi:hypothetical protein